MTTVTGGRAARPRRRAAIPARISIAVRSAASAVIPAVLEGRATPRPRLRRRGRARRRHGARPQQLAGGQPPGLGGAGPRGEGRIEHVDVDGQIGARRRPGHGGERPPAPPWPGRARRPRPWRASESPGRASSRSPRDRARFRVARPGRCWRRAGSPPRPPPETECRVRSERHTVGRRVRVGVEVEHGELIRPESLGQHAQRRQRQRVVPAEHQRHGPGAEDLAQAWTASASCERMRSPGAAAASP